MSLIESLIESSESSLLNNNNLVPPVDNNQTKSKKTIRRKYISDAKLLLVKKYIEEENYELKRLKKEKVITEKEYELIVLEKKNALASSLCCELLGCSIDTLNRLDQGNRMPHSLLVWSRQYKQDIRLWLLGDIERAIPLMHKWLDEDIKKKKCAKPKKINYLDALTPEGCQFLLQKFDQYILKSKNKEIYELEKAKEQILLNKQREEIIALKNAEEIESKRIYAEMCNLMSKKSIQEKWSSDPGNLYPIARKINRKWTAYLGPTNSGKTFDAIEALKTSPKGIYLAPLRLLALEVYESLIKNGVKASLLTGEERLIDPHSTITCSTIEMLNIEQEVDLVVIDEIQMLNDRQRGWAWTHAILGSPAKNIIAVGSISAKPILEKITKHFNEEINIVIKERFTPLSITQNLIRPSDIKAGTLFVVFSKRSVIDWGEFFKRKGFSVSQIYGDLPPEVRREEARRFRENESQIMVATDAIAMGLNLPAEYVVIGENEKYDGFSMGRIPTNLIRQIAGRAGRYGIHDAGYVAGSEKDIHKSIENALKGHDASLELPFSYQATPMLAKYVSNEQSDIPLHVVLEVIKNNIGNSNIIRYIEPNELNKKIKQLDDIKVREALPIETRMQLACSPVDMDRDGHLFSAYLTGILNNSKIAPPSLLGITKIDDFERIYRHCSIFTWYHYHFPEIFKYIDDCNQVKTECVDAIILKIKKGLRMHCKSCGNVLPIKHKHAKCETCFRNQRRQYRNNDYYGYDDDF
jgi:ATP-dependent RNA helicase SUPV3L1/SUV3